MPMRAWHLGRETLARWAPSWRDMLVGPARLLASLGDRMPKGLYARSLLIIITPIVILQAVVAYVFMEKHWQSVTSRLSAATTSEFSSNTNLGTLAGTIQTALNTLQAQATGISGSLSVVQNRQNFTNQMINTLQTGADNLVLADPNQEGANLLALQTRQSLSTTALSMASQAQQAVLRLFQ